MIISFQCKIIILLLVTMHSVIIRAACSENLEMQQEHGVPMLLNDTLIFSSLVTLTLYSYCFKKLDFDHLTNFD